MVPDRQRPDAARRTLADDALLALLHEVAETVVGFAVHHVSAAAGLAAGLFEPWCVDVEVGEADGLLDQDVAPRHQDDLAGGEPGEQKNRTVFERDDGGVGLDLLVRDHRRRELGLDRLDLHSCKGLLVDPERSPVERASLLRRLESHDVTVICTDPLGSRQRVAVVVREPQLKWKREHLLGLQQRKRRPVGTPLGAIDRERQLLPLDAVAGDKVPVGGDDVIPWIGDIRSEVLRHPDIRGVVLHQRVLRPLLLLVPRDDFVNREPARRRDAGALGEHRRSSSVEIDEHRTARQRHARA